MEIRRALAADAHEIAKMESEYFADAWAEEDIRSYICSELSMCFTAVDSDGICAYILGRKIIPEGEIYRIAVRESKRRRGIGSRLLSYALKTEIGSGVETVFLEVREKNVAARGLYSAEGFSEIGLRKNYYKSPTDNAIIMVYGLKCQ